MCVLPRQAVEIYLQSTQLQSCFFRTLSVFLGMLFKPKFPPFAVKPLFHTLWGLGMGSAGCLLQRNQETGEQNYSSGSFLQENREVMETELPASGVGFIPKKI